ncbi:MAG: hypothetical protein JW776_11835 [Candidatus Lokiarchaeota archaeon]|nr:hypothetical protein [Candidatus Lokiarchaeota archaeon]
MSIKIAMCNKCWYQFPLDEKMESIVCPYCKFSGSDDEFEIDFRDTYGTGYKKTIKDFQDLLRVLSRYKIKSFFKKDVKV